MSDTAKISDSSWAKIEKELDREVKSYVKSIKKEKQKDSRFWNFTSLTFKNLTFCLTPSSFRRIYSETL